MFDRNSFLYKQARGGGLLMNTKREKEKFIPPPFVSDISFESNKKIVYNAETNTYSMSLVKDIQVVDMTNQKLVDCVIEHAEKSGVTDLTLIDKGFFKIAIKNELQRQKAAKKEK